MENPMENFRPLLKREPIPSTAKVHIKKGEELKVFQLLKDRGVIKWELADRAFTDAGGIYLNGLFGVVKPLKFTQSNLPVLRCIMNLIPSNSLFDVIQGDISYLPSAPAWAPLLLHDGQELHMSQSDMSAAFYLFEFPDCWAPFMMFYYKIGGSLVDQEAGIWYCPTCRALPMGWRTV